MALEGERSGRIVKRGARPLNLRTPSSPSARSPFSSLSPRENLETRLVLRRKTSSFQRSCASFTMRLYIFTRLFVAQTTMSGDVTRHNFSNLLHFFPTLRIFSFSFRNPFAISTTFEIMTKEEEEEEVRRNCTYIVMGNCNFSGKRTRMSLPIIIIL